jgi:hypothetical protein
MDIRAGCRTQRLREAMLTLRLAPGTRPVKREMVDRPEASSTSVRAALNSLEAEDLVVRGQCRGSRLQSIAWIKACSRPGLLSRLKYCPTELYDQRIYDDEQPDMSRHRQG